MQFNISMPITVKIKCTIQWNKIFFVFFLNSLRLSCENKWQKTESFEYFRFFYPIMFVSHRIIWEQHKNALSAQTEWHSEWSTSYKSDNNQRRSQICQWLCYLHAYKNNHIRVCEQFKMLQITNIELQVFRTKTSSWTKIYSLLHTKTFRFRL